MVKPFVTHNQVFRLANEIFSLKIDTSVQSTLKELESYDDRNFYVRGAKDGIEGQFVFKVLNPDDSANNGILEDTHAAMVLLDKNGIPCCVPQPTVSGKLFEIRQFSATPESRPPVKRAKTDDKPEMFDCAVILLSFLPGKTMRDVPCSTDLFFKVGCFTAKVNRVLKDCMCPHLKDRYCIWDLYNFHEAKKLRCIIKDADQKKLLHNIEKSFKNIVQPKLESLPEQCIHGDVNEANLIIKDMPGSKDQEISGLIDFGDMNYSCRVFEVSIVAAYMMTMFLEDPVTAGAHTVAGYQQQNPLTQEENDVIFYLIQARLYQSVCFGTNSSELFPENSEYLMYSVKRAWKVLDRLTEISTDEFNEEWKKLL